MKEFFIIFGSIAGVIIFLMFLLIWLVINPQDERRATYCASHGWEYLSIDRSWVCRDPNTHALYR